MCHVAITSAMNAMIIYLKEYVRASILGNLLGWEED